MWTGRDEVQLTTTDNWSARIQGFFKILSLVLYVFEIFYCKIFIFRSDFYLHSGCLQETLKSLKIGAGSHLFLQSQHQTPSQNA